MEDLSLHSHHGLLERYENTNANSFCEMSAMTQDMLTDFQESNMFFGFDNGKVMAEANPALAFNSFQGYAPATFGSLDSQCPSSDIPSLMDDLCSPAATSESSTAMNFVDPTQTTLIDTLADFQSSPIGPLTPVKFGTPSSDFNAQGSFNNSPAGTSSTGYLLPPQNYRDLRHNLISPVRQQHLRRPYFESPESTAAPQKIQATTPTRAAARRNIKREPTLSIRIENSAKLPCPHPGCDKKFQRKEHLKRHEVIHNPLALKYPCPFCERKFGRTDNLKPHIERHGRVDRKAARVAFHPDAEMAVTTLARKSRKTKGLDAKSLSSRTRLSGC
ncbi:predicted protein [Sclerotinia sclerotiorum 1980 UF-70]|uniref:C2H2-type domain-containing protein n=2 Tax=Sclerotinia sclerotiorum (strain ATCC 18683 / 1980 / Ss-1) TaxID=665079 RepID=A7E517_SCLS1|nr:predicted protein [Sclerotinia sclerotiorum 1980 UF-70]APA07982.1 hypothetical protein sscle_03g027520 [Sclerotinia sclerotiorum 1980 UF-70]EDN90989.1 predicted protein [Sclerotinia sclerotiorum 1980 UF-70]